jgi:hypothetical protein
MLYKLFHTYIYISDNMGMKSLMVPDHIMQRSRQRSYAELAAAIGSPRRVRVTEEEYAFLERVSTNGFGTGPGQAIAQLEKIDRIFKRATGTNMTAGFYDNGGCGCAQGIARQLLDVCSVEASLAGAKPLTEAIQG